MAPHTYVYLELRLSRASLLIAMNNIRELHEPRARHILSDKHSIEERLLKGAEKSYGSADLFGFWSEYMILQYKWPNCATIYTM